MALILKAENIVKTFGEVVANDHVSFEVEEGSIHCLLGENGAGKSTLVNILYGLYPADSGRLYIDGKETKLHSPADALKQGIGMVAQQFSLVPRLTVSENVILSGIPRNAFGAVNMKVAHEKVAALAKSCGFTMDLDAKVEDISTGEQQRVEIVKALYRGVRLLILDEPTAVLVSQEIDDLFRVMRTMTSEGRAVVLITHKLDEALRCDQITALRAGKVTLNTVGSKTNKDELLRAMFGQTVVAQECKPIMTKDSKKILEVSNLRSKSHSKRSELKGVSFDVHSGEIFGIAGVAGNGQSELVEIITGLKQPTDGAVILNEEKLCLGSPIVCREHKIAHLSEHAKRTGSFATLSIAHNLIAGRENQAPFSKGFLLNPTGIKDLAKRSFNLFDIKAPSDKTLAGTLSGGNLQKVMLARELDQEPELVVAANPTRGLDAKTTEVVYEKLIEQRNKGKAVLLVSTDLTELFALADRIGVMFEGKMTIMPADPAMRSVIEHMMVGTVAESPCKETIPNETERIAS